MPDNERSSIYPTDILPPGQSLISRKRPHHPRRRRHERNVAENHKHVNERDQRKGTTLRVAHTLVKDLNERTMSWGLEGLVNVTKTEKKEHDHPESKNAVESDTEYHSPRYDL